MKKYLNLYLYPNLFIVIGILILWMMKVFWFQNSSSYLISSMVFLLFSIPIFVVEKVKCEIRFKTSRDNKTAAGVLLFVSIILLEIILMMLLGIPKTLFGMMFIGTCAIFGAYIHWESRPAYFQLFIGWSLVISVLFLQ